LLGNDVSTLELGDPIMTLISNRDLIRINQDPLGKPARCVYNCDTFFVAAQLWSHTGNPDDDYRIYVGELQDAHVIAVTS